MINRYKFRYNYDSKTVYESEFCKTERTHPTEICGIPDTCNVTDTMRLR